MSEKPIDKWGNEITYKRSLTKLVILTFFFGFVGVLYADVRYGLYLGIVFLGNVILLLTGLLFSMSIIGFFILIFACLSYYAYRIVCLCIGVNVCADKNERWMLFENGLKLKHIEKIDC